MIGPGYPLLLDVAGRRTLVVGGGPVAARRAAALAQAGADVHVVAPTVCEDIAALAEAGAATVHPRSYADGDVAGAWLVQACTGDRLVDEAVADACEADRIWCVRADDAEASAAWTPAVTRTAGVTVSVNAAGDPRRAVAVKNAVAAALQTGQLPLRPRRPGDGQVALVGGGPGDPGLITTRGRALLAQADVVVIDRLAPRALLDELDPDVEVVEAGKAPHVQALRQDEINDLLVDRARLGQRVVRLKGGDPFVLGRGGEEAAACRAAGVAVQVVPGVTSAVAAAAAAGIPVTHRGVARQVTIASAHGGSLDWAALAQVEGTLVLLMAVAALHTVAHQLVAYGKPADTPVAVVESATSPDQRATVGDLATIAGLARAAGIAPPAVVIVGDVVRLRELIA